MPSYKVVHKGTSLTHAHPLNDATSDIHVIVSGLDDTADALDVAREGAVAFLGLTHPFWPSSVIKPSYAHARAEWVRGYADGTDGAVALVVVHYNFPTETTVFGASAEFETGRAEAMFYSLKPQTDYTSAAGGQTATSGYHKNGWGNPVQRRAFFPFQKITVTCITQFPQASWAAAYEGKLLTNAVTIAGRAYAANTLMFNGIRQRYVESQQQPCHFEFECRPLAAWLNDEVVGGVVKSVATQPTVSFTPPTI